MAWRARGLSGLREAYGKCSTWCGAHASPTQFFFADGGTIGAGGGIRVKCGYFMRVKRAGAAAGGADAEAVRTSWRLHSDLLKLSLIHI